ncbi:MAG TPA: hypothetical protein PK079_13645 [Leptospiraceae bacterium]|nr:hypothetical protein [Leptospiraceae bacterium]HMW07518.1 hypothetical protein [Leptospiraceae bacterium]HMX33304.1 hypothetical protein [Leptospiraceae bacterium]HMY33181.1 hypothetical protein [Leptospiraceae bacterium]HMZ67231.1 hypothetical protein [Leptospiraceae bacterium]
MYRVDRISAKDISIDYNITGNVKIGLTILAVDKTYEFNQIISHLRCNVFSSCIDYTKMNPWTGKLYTMYFHFLSPSIYLEPLEDCLIFLEKQFLIILLFGSLTVILLLNISLYPIQFLRLITTISLLRNVKELKVSL